MAQSFLNEDELYVPEDIIKEARSVIENLLPRKSVSLYEKEYNIFCAWRKSRNIKGVSEEVLLSYFAEKVKKYKASTLWSCYSKLKSTLLIKEQVDISKFLSLKTFLKREYSTYTPIKSNVLEREHFNKFLEDAPDKIYLLIKVALVMGIGGGCRMDELHKMKIDDIEDRDNILIIQVPETKTNKKRMFTIVDNTKIGVSKLALYKKYSDLRPANTPTKSFFLGYRNEKCTKQVVGINTFYKMPRMIAEFLKLPLPESYTGHCFRRSSATLLANTGANTLMMKRHGGWKSNSVVEGYIDESVENKKEICNRILMGTSSTKNCQGFSNELPGCSGANLIKSEDVVNFIKSKDVANENTVKCGGKVFKKCTFNFY
ncbi:uncharacterized protein [Tenebrio molitor]|jgi:integrase|uniref:uncharacterized protein n=2 Tax=Tenebrio molitor TaxID=7067 RepID=UPI001C39E67C|nr:unnamed protein product [Tenebrio molitor]